MDDDLPPFSEALLASKLFRARSALSRADKIGAGIMGFVELIKMAVQAVRDRKKPKPAREIFDANPSELEAIRREAGRTMVGEPER